MTNSSEVQELRTKIFPNIESSKPSGFIDLHLLNAGGEAYIKSVPGVKVTAKEGIELLKKIVIPEWKKSFLADVTEHPRDYAYYAVREKGNGKKGPQYFTNLYCEKTVAKAA